MNMEKPNSLSIFLIALGVSLLAAFLNGARAADPPPDRVVITQELYLPNISESGGLLGDPLCVGEDGQLVVFCDLAEGPQGPEGPEGPAGPTGPQGDTGPIPRNYAIQVSFQVPANGLAVATLQCNAGDLPVGSGYRTNNGSQFIAVVSSTPQPSSNSYEFEVSNSNASNAYAASASVVCLDFSEPFHSAGLSTGTCTQAIVDAQLYVYDCSE